MQLRILSMNKKLSDYLFYEESNPNIKIYLGDSSEILPLIETCDLLLIDPPYGIFEDMESDGVMFGKETIYSVDKTATEWDKRPSKELISLAMSKAKYWTIWGGNYFADYLGASKGTLVWNKKTGNNTYADGELAFTNTVGTMRIFNHQWCGAFKDSERGLRAVHPTQKPVQLMKWCIQKSKYYDLHLKILDCFMGSGSTAIACKELKKDFIGIEVSEKYCQIAVKRLQNTQVPFL